MGCDPYTRVTDPHPWVGGCGLWQVWVRVWVGPQTPTGYPCQTLMINMTELWLLYGLYAYYDYYDYYD